jgi:hypothetical protein
MRADADFFKTPNDVPRHLANGVRPVIMNYLLYLRAIGMFELGDILLEYHIKRIHKTRHLHVIP